MKKSPDENIAAKVTRGVSPSEWEVKGLVLSAVIERSESAFRTLRAVAVNDRSVVYDVWSALKSIAAKVATHDEYPEFARGRETVIGGITDVFLATAYMYEPRWYSFSMGDKGKSKYEDRKQYPYIPSRLTMIAKLMSCKYTGQYGRGKSFIDIGCGIGDKVFMAALHSGSYNLAHGRFVGLEYDYATAAVAEEVKGHLPGKDMATVRFIQADALKYKDFGAFDRIYTYLPMTDDASLSKFYGHIWRQLPPDAMWFELAGGKFLNFLQENSCVYEQNRTPFVGSGVLVTKKEDKKR